MCVALFRLLASTRSPILHIVCLCLVDNDRIYNAYRQSASSPSTTAAATRVIVLDDQDALGCVRRGVCVLFTRWVPKQQHRLFQNTKRTLAGKDTRQLARWHPRSQQGLGSQHRRSCRRCSTSPRSHWFQCKFVVLHTFHHFLLWRKSHFLYLL